MPVSRNRWFTILALLIAVAIGYLGQQAPFEAPVPDAPEALPTTADQQVRADASAIDELFAAGQSDVLVSGKGRIARILRDDNDGSRHQRLIVELPSGLTVLIAHNIDLAPRVPNPEVGAALGFRGEYEWNDKGGVVHWTHHDPRGQHPGGWLEYRGKRYE